MKFGIFLEISVPRPLTRQAEQEAFANALEQARVADELGFDRIWVVEHHFLEEYSHCSAPELVLTAIATQTTRIRIGHGAVVCVPEINPPVRVAERAAVLDVISGGRVDLGTARSSTWTELGGFNVDPDSTKKAWDEYVRALPKMWAEGTYRHDGQCFSMPERNVLPKPVQDPHPPLWVTVTSPGTELDAADRGIGCLGVAAASFEEQERRTKEYRRRIQLCEPVSSVVNDEVATLSFLYCHEDGAVAEAKGAAMLGSFGHLNAHLLSARESYPTRAYQTLGNLLSSSGSVVDSSSPGEGRKVPPGVSIGTPDQCIAEIARWEAVDVDSINYMVNSAEMLDQSDVLESMRLFSREVMPKFNNTQTVKES